MRASLWMGASAASVAVLIACRLPLNGTGAPPGDDGGPPSGLEGGADAADDDMVGDDAALPPVGPPDFAWYPLTETSGTTAHDATSHHYDVTNLAGVTWGQGASFDGTGGGGSVLVDPGLRQAPISLTAWLAPDSRVDESATSHGIIPFPPSAVSGDAQGQYGYGLGLDIWNGGSALAVEDVGYTFQNVGGALFVTGTEYFVATAIGSTIASVYVDGQLVGQATPQILGPAASTTLFLGVHNEDPAYGTKRFYAGRMRDVRVYRRELTEEEVAALHAAGPASGP